MDPDATLREIRARIVSIRQRAALEGVDYDAEQLVELVQSLDDWLSSGGFLPADWSRHG